MGAIWQDPWLATTHRTLPLTRADWTGLTYEQAWALLRAMQEAKGGANRKFEIRRMADSQLHQLVECA